MEPDPRLHGDVDPVEADAHPPHRDVARHLDRDPGVAAADLVGRARQDLDLEVTAVVTVLAAPAGAGMVVKMATLAPDGSVWDEDGKVDHNITKVVSGVATTALDPTKGAQEIHQPQ